MSRSFGSWELEVDWKLEGLAVKRKGRDPRKEAAPSMPLSLSLEVVPQRYLHAPWPAQHCAVGAKRGGVLEAHVQRAGVEVWRVGQIEDLQPDRQFVSLGIEHVEGLGEGHVHRPIGITTQNVALTAFSHRRKPEALDRLVRIRKEVRVGLARAFVGDTVCGVGRRARPVLQTEVEFRSGGAQVALPCKFQLVGQVRPLIALAGRPVLKRTTLETCQPPMSWSTKPDTSEPKRRPRPNGSSQET